MSSNDFLSWDEIPAGYFSWEYTEEEIQSESGADSDNDFCVSPRRTAPAAAKKKHFKCPDCSNMYSSVSGFRGHVLRKHNKPYLKASDHRVEVESGSELHTDQGSSCLQESDLHTIIRDAINSMLEDPFLHMSSDGVEIQILGEDILSSTDPVYPLSRAVCAECRPRATPRAFRIHHTFWDDCTHHNNSSTSRLRPRYAAGAVRVFGPYASRGYARTEPTEKGGITYQQLVAKCASGGVTRRLFRTARVSALQGW
ncbi:hypothetical protein BaRGS_00015746, partial [Batillaria attramentaria]